MLQDIRLQSLFKIIKKYKVQFQLSSSEEFSYYCSRSKKIVISTYDCKGNDATYNSLITSLAHEVAHLIDDKSKKYKSYYHSDKFYFIVAIAAERSCDLFALRFIRENIDKNYPVRQKDFPYLCNQDQDYSWLHDLLKREIII